VPSLLTNVQCSEKFNVSCGQSDADAWAAGIILSCRIHSEALSIPLYQTCTNYFRTRIDQLKHIAHKEAKSPWCFLLRVQQLRQVIITEVFRGFLHYFQENVGI